MALLAPAGLAVANNGGDGPGTAAAGTPSCLGKRATIVGTPGADELHGTAGRDVIVGLAGDDRIKGGGGDDLICGGAGADVVAGDSGDDRLEGGSGDDLLRGGRGRNHCDGGGGIDRLRGCERTRSPEGGSTGTQGPVDAIPLDSPPTAVADEAAMEEGASATTIPVLANDTDADGGPISVEAVSSPAHGTASVADGGLDVTYQPETTYCNDGETPDSFSYSLNGGSAATVSVRVTCVTEVSIDQGLFPKFSPDIADYVVHCDGSPLEVSGRTAEGAEIAVDGQPPTTGPFQAAVPLEANQEFSFDLTEGGEQSTYHVRCLPPDFPVWEYERLLPPRHRFYVVTPTFGTGSGPYVVVFDDHGVPLWWYASTPGPIDAKVLASGDITWWGQFGQSNGYRIRAWDGSVVHTVSAVGGSTDIHEMQPEPNGDYLVISYQPREHVDLTPFGGGPDDSVVDGEVQEINPAGEEVWSWSTQGHIGLDETGRWWPTALKSEKRDIVHMNAVEPDGENAILISLRHTDAVYKIDKATGNVMWKLGGSWTPKSLTVHNDPEGAYPLGGQHDVRLQPDGTVTIHDNNTNLPSPPRAVRYQIDETAKTATLVEQVTDPAAPSSFCCGSARRSADGSWLIGWGGNSLVTEFDPAGQRTFRLGFGGTAFSYRAVSAPDGVLSTAALRAGMDSMHPRP